MPVTVPVDDSLSPYPSGQREAAQNRWRRSFRGSNPRGDISLRSRAVTTPPCRGGDARSSRAGETSGRWKSLAFTHSRRVFTGEPVRRREFLHLTCNENTQVRILPVPLADDPFQERPTRSSGVVAKLTALTAEPPVRIRAGACGPGAYEDRRAAFNRRIAGSNPVGPSRCLGDPPGGGAGLLPRSQEVRVLPQALGTTSSIAVMLPESPLARDASLSSWRSGVRFPSGALGNWQWTATLCVVPSR